MVHGVIYLGLGIMAKLRRYGKDASEDFGILKDYCIMSIKQ